MNPNREKIGWCDFTKVGELCYALRQAKRKEHVCPKCYAFEPHLHPERLEEPYQRKKPAKIFVCSMADLFGDFIPREWIEQVIQVAKDNPQHIFQFLTKNPKRYHEFDFPRNCWLGTTVNCQDDMYRLIDLSLTPSKNLIFVSFEPLYSEIQMTFYRPPDWIIIGAQTNPPNPPVQPRQEWIEKLISDARTIGARVFLKDNLDYPEKIKEFPAP